MYNCTGMEHFGGVGCVHCILILTILNYELLYTDGTPFGVGCEHCTLILTILNYVQLYRDETLVWLLVNTTLILTILNYYNCTGMKHYWGWLCTLYYNISYIKLCTIVQGWNTLVGLVVYKMLNIFKKSEYPLTPVDR